MAEQTNDRRPVLTPGPDHPITIEHNASHVRVWVADTLVADTHNAITLREADYPPVEYIPLTDIDRSLLRATGHTTYCPYKGDCNYFTIEVGAIQAENAVWEYREPRPAVAQIKDHVAFYPDRVDQRTE